MSIRPVPLQRVRFFATVQHLVPSAVQLPRYVLLVQRAPQLARVALTLTNLRGSVCPSAPRVRLATLRASARHRLNHALMVVRGSTVNVSLGASQMNTALMASVVRAGVRAASLLGTSRRARIVRPSCAPTICQPGSIAVSTSQTPAVLSIKAVARGSKAAAAPVCGKAERAHLRRHLSQVVTLPVAIRLPTPVSRAIRALLARSRLAQHRCRHQRRHLLVMAVPVRRDSTKVLTVSVTRTTNRLR